MATQLPLFLIRNGFTLPGGFALGALPIAANVGQNTDPGDAVLCAVHPRANSITVQIEGGTGAISFAAQTINTPIVEPFFPLVADTPQTFDISNHPINSGTGLKQLYLSFDAAVTIPPNVISGIAHP